MDVPQPETITKSTRDPEELRARFEAWLDRQLPGADVRVLALRAPESNGMSSETLLVDAVWSEDGEPVERALVARVAPDTSDVPVFPVYDLEVQFRAIRLVGEHAPDVPVPATRWLELDPDVLGAPFFVMDRVEGRVPPDVLPYTFEGWLLDATEQERRRLQDRTVEVLAGIHGVDLAALAAEGHDVGFLHDATHGATSDDGSPLRRHVEHWRSYYEWVREDRTYPLLEAAFAWLDQHWPVEEGDPVITWGDARIGNVIYQGFEPAAVLDWEMVGVGPRGIDLGWMSFLHTFFQDITEVMGLPGLPDMLRLEDVAATYERASGVAVGDLDFYRVYAALRHGIVMARVHERRVHFGEAEAVTDPDDAVMHRDRLAELIGWAPGT